MNLPSLNVLDDQGIEALHRASMEILDTIGVRIPHPEMRTLFRAAGAEVDNTTQVVKIPEQLIMACLASVGKSFTLYGRDHKMQAVFGEGTRNYSSSAGQASWIDDTGTKRRSASLDDIPVAACIADGLPWINLVGAMSDPHEIPVEYRCVSVAAELVKHTTKPVGFWFHDRASCRYLLEVLVAVAGNEAEAARFPLTHPFLEPVSPLEFPFHGIDLIFETARLSLPVPVGPMAQTGATAPCSLAGTLAQENAEILAGICVTQLIKPGLAVIYAGIPHAFDMRTTQLIFAGPEQALMAVAMTQMGKHYNLPVSVNVGLTDSKIPDAQAGLEAGITLVCGAMAGAEAFGSFGICGVDQGASLAMLVMQNELVGYVERILDGIEISEDKIGLDVIRTVGHGGNFLAEKHTLQNFKKELWFPNLLDRQFWSKWSMGGALSMQARCISMKDKILREHQPEPLDEDISRELDKIVASARKNLLAGEECR